MADFLVALAAFHRERLWIGMGYSSVFHYLRRELKLSSGSAFLRKTAAELLQRFPEVEGPLRDGRLCISSVAELAKVMTPENRIEVLPRFFYASKNEAKALAAEIAPREAIPQRVVVTTLAPRALPSRAAANAAAAPASALSLGLAVPFFRAKGGRRCRTPRQPSPSAPFFRTNASTCCRLWRPPWTSGASFFRTKRQPWRWRRQGNPALPCPHRRCPRRRRWRPRRLACRRRPPRAPPPSPSRPLSTGSTRRCRRSSSASSPPRRTPSPTPSPGPTRRPSSMRGSTSSWSELRSGRGS